MHFVNDSDTLLTVRQLQDLLRVDRITIYRMLSDGRLRGFKVGGQWRFSRQAIEAWLRQQQANLAAVALPATSMAGQPLSPPSDALPLSCLEAIQDILAQALGIAVVTTAPDGTPLTAVANSCRFCTLILDTEAGRQRCNGSWRAAAAQHRPASGRHPGPGPQLATCHAGLSYACDHVEVGGRLVAVVHAGQFLDRSPLGEGSPARLAELAAATGRPVESLQAALSSIPVLDEERQHRLAHLLRRVAGTFAEIGAERLNLMGRLRRIADITQL